MTRKTLSIIGAVIAAVLVVALAVFLISDDDEPGVSEENRSDPTTTISVEDDTESSATPDPTTTVVEEPVTIPGEPMVVGSGPVTVEVFADPRCPGCARLATAHGREIDQAVEDGKITVAYHLLDLGLVEGDDYSERANAAIRCAVDTEPVLASRMAGTILGMAPPKDQSLTNEELVGVSQSLIGLPAEAEQCILNGDKREEARTSSEAGRDRLAEIGARGVPTVLVNGEPVDPSAPDWLSAHTG